MLLCARFFLKTQVSQSGQMALEVRPTNPNSGIDKPCVDFTFYSGEWRIGRIYKVHDAPIHLRWAWSLELQGPMKLSDQVPSLQEAEAQLHASWQVWKDWAKMIEGPLKERARGQTARTKIALLLAFGAVAAFFLFCPLLSR
jgi:hypothetical protein